MKLLAIILMLVSLFLLYRIAYPKQTDTAKDDAAPPEKSKPATDVMGKSRFVLPDRSQPLQTPATSTESEQPDKKEDIFAAETETQRSAVIPAEQLSEVFGDDTNPEVMSLPLEDDEVDFEAEEEAEELNRVLGNEAIPADGIDYDDLQTVVKVVKEQPETVNEETGRTLAALENTDMFELLASGDEGKINWIKAVVERHIQNTMPETENETSGMDYDYGDFDSADYLS
jgi:hypothetical protein